jgi:hypothetical protein
MLLGEERAICWAGTFDRNPLNMANITKPPALSAFLRIFQGLTAVASKAE